MMLLAGDLDGILGLIPEGVSVSAVVAVVVIFVKNSRLFADRLGEIASECHDRHKEAQEAHEKQVKGIVEHFTGTIKSLGKSHERSVDRMHRQMETMNRSLSVVQDRLERKND